MRTLSCYVMGLVLAAMPGALAMQTQTLPKPKPVYEQPLATFKGIYSNDGGQVAAGQFLLRARATVTGVMWYGFFRGAVVDPTKTRQDFRISFFSDRAGLPTPRRSYERTVRVRVRDSGRRTTGFAGSERVIYEFVADPIPAFTVAARVPTWISIATPGPPTINWLWSTGPPKPGGTTASRNTNPARLSDWQLNRQVGQLAFTLIGSWTSPRDLTWLSGSVVRPLGTASGA